MFLSDYKEGGITVRKNITLDSRGIVQNALILVVQLMRDTSVKDTSGPLCIPKFFFGFTFFQDKSMEGNPQIKICKNSSIKVKAVNRGIRYRKFSNEWFYCQSSSEKQRKYLTIQFRETNLKTY